MRPEMKSTRNKMLTQQKRNYVYITFHCGRNEMKFRFGGGPRQTVHSVKANHSCLRMCRSFLLYDFISGSVYMVFCHQK